MNRRLLVTGATGCIGRHVLPLLQPRGWEVHAISSRAHPADSETGTVWHRANLLASDELKTVVREVEATHLLHLAWYIAPGRWASAPENFDWVRASLELIAAFQRCGGTRVVTAGSCLEYDWSYGYCSEDRTPLAPHTAYGTCKDALRRLTSAFTGVHGMTSAWGRVFFVYGPHEHPDRLIASVVRSLLAGEPARCSHGNQIRDYLFVEDVADALVRLLESDASGAVNIASGQPIALKDIVNKAGALIGRPDLIRLGAIPAAPTDAPLVVGDVSRLTDQLSWRPRFDLDAGLTRTIAWWRQRLPLAEARTS